MSRAAERRTCCLGVHLKGLLQKGWQADVGRPDHGELIAVQEEHVSVLVPVLEQAVLEVGQLAMQPPAHSAARELCMTACQNVSHWVPQCAVQVPQEQLAGYTGAVARWQKAHSWF